jgi:hypothetical protein
MRRYWGLLGFIRGKNDAAGVRDCSIPGRYGRAGESLRVLLFNFHKINQAKKKVKSDFSSMFPARNAGAFFLPEPCVRTVLRAAWRPAFPQRWMPCTFFMVKGMELLVCKKHAV